LKNEDRIEKLTEWLDEQGQQADDYVEHEDNINNYAECFEGSNLFYGEIDEELQDEVKGYLEDMDAYDILEFCNEPDLHYGYNCRYNEIWSMNIGEVEHQFTGLYDHETKSNCIYTDLCKGLSAEEIKQAENKSDYYISRGCLYIDRTYDRVSIVLDVDRLLKEKRKYPKLKLVM
jgi:hypothetical protein